MCGICGIKGLRPQERDKHLGDMLAALRHRGPDEEGRYSTEDISLGIRRLSIIDLETGSQPIYNEDKTIAIACNGEIYNFQALRDNLIGKGHLFYTRSDVEVVVHLYEEHGPDCLKHIKGMFAFALWDKKGNILFIARDRFGIKPLYYYCKNGIFAFASELKALLKLPFITRELNLRALSLYFRLEYVPSPHSIFNDIYKLRPAHYILYKGNGLKFHRYWDLENRPCDNNLSYFDIREKLKELLDDSVREHLISDVPLGIFLSGGIDSSILTALAKRLCGKDLVTFSMGFDEESFDESKYALLVSKRFQTKHHSFAYTIDDFINNFHNVIDNLDEPFGDLSIFPTYMLSKSSAKHIKVALSGEGGDELFMGYPTYSAHKYMNLFNRLPRSLKTGAGNLINSLPASFEYFSLDFKLKQFAKGIGQNSPALRHILWMEAFSEGERNLFFSDKFRQDDAGGNNVINDFIENFTRNRNLRQPYKAIQYLDFFTYLSEDLLVKSDRSSMLSSLEVRVPYLDHKLVEFIWGLSSKVIYQKRLLKDAVKDIIPGEVLFRPKQGFPIPFSKWLKNSKFFKMIDYLFAESFIKNQGLFNYEYIDFLLKEHLSGRQNNRKKLRTYMMFQCWYEHWL